MKSLQPGTVLKKRFEILQELGSGGMAVVYLANDQELNRKVAIKVLHLFMLSDEDSRVRFEREAQILSQLSNLHLPQLFSSGLLVDDVPYLVFEFIDGVSLADEIKKAGGLPWKRALKIATQIATAMQYVHENGVVHRDLKPRNLMLSKDGNDFVKVLDFGLAKALSLSIGSTITSTGALIGTPQYMSPEQCKGVACDEAADIYALGCIIYEMLTGYPPFNSTEFVSLIRKHEREQPELVSKKMNASDLPRNIDAVVLKALEKEPEKRYRSMSQFSEALEKCL
ncbi:MAG TPA: serine/threonine-protein kinase, partial [Candidatus Melainabacteria bacterium]|nr:serine/threonine-protein kinase [Candidatus Melainabacteria bacterium]